MQLYNGGKKMDEKVEAKTQVKAEKKNKTRMSLVLLFLVIVAVIGYIALRGEYLELLEIGTNYTAVFWQNLTYKSVVFAISFIILFIIIYFTYFNMIDIFIQLFLCQ